MENGAVTQSDTRSCEVCGTSVAAEAATCGACGAQLNADRPTGTRAPEEATNVIRTAEPPVGAAPAAPRFTAAGLPTRRPASDDVGEEELFSRFTRSWEQQSEPQPEPAPGGYQPHVISADELAPPMRTPSIDEYIRSRGTAEPPHPGKPVEPPEPREPPPPVEPPKPVEPPPVPQPPTPFPPEPAPPPQPQPQPQPPISPVPPVPTPDPVPPIPPGPPLPTPPPGLRIGGTVPTPGVYQGGTYSQLDTEIVTGVIVPPPLRPGTVYGRQSRRPAEVGAEPSVEMSGSLTGAILSRGQEQTQRRVRRRARLRTALFATIGALVFIAAIATVVAILAGDFIRSLFHTLAGIV